MAQTDCVFGPKGTSGVLDDLSQ